MDNSEELKMLVEKVQVYTRNFGKKLTQKQMAERLSTNDKYFSGLINGKEDVTEKFLLLFKSVFKKELNSDKDFVEINLKKLLEESQMSSIEANIKLDYVIGLLAEVQEKVDQTKTATIVASKVQRLVQSDFEAVVLKLKQ